MQYYIEVQYIFLFLTMQYMFLALIFYSVRLDSITQLQMWKVALRSGLQSDCDNLLRLCESEIHLSVQEQEVWKPAEEVLKLKRPDHIHLCLHVGQGTQHITTSSMKIIFDCLSNIADIR